MTMPNSIPEQIQMLSIAKDRLNASDKTFADSLCTQHSRGRDLSTKQIYWVGKLLEKASRPAAAASPEVQVNLTRIVELFETARQHLKFPAVVLAVQSRQPLQGQSPITDPSQVHELIRFNMAGQAARYPGSINVTSFEKNPATGRRDFYGRILTDGKFDKHDNASISPALLDLIIKAIRRFAEDPVRVAADHGRLTGHCCFCHRRLEDERSTSVGYGPVCARHFGLPWGSTADHPFNCEPVEA